jgi:hypothetical protein
MVGEFHVILTIACHFRNAVQWIAHYRQLGPQPYWWNSNASHTFVFNKLFFKSNISVHTHWHVYLMRATAKYWRLSVDEFATDADKEQVFDVLCWVLLSFSYMCSILHTYIYVFILETVSGIIGSLKKYLVKLKLSMQPVLACVSILMYYD